MDLPLFPFDHTEDHIVFQSVAYIVISQGPRVFKSITFPLIITRISILSAIACIVNPVR